MVEGLLSILVPIFLLENPRKELNHFPTHMLSTLRQDKDLLFWEHIPVWLQ